MQQNSDDNKSIFHDIDYFTGSAEILQEMPYVSVKHIFDDEIMTFLDALSNSLMKNAKSKAYPDVMTLAFWLRRASLHKLQKRFKGDAKYQLGRGVTFHIAPSNVPVNFAYSLISGLLSGNANIVRISSKDFEQLDLIVQTINQVLENFKELQKYICIIRYERDRKDLTDALSEIADTRVIWGGDETIASIRKSHLKPRATEVAFADRFSMAVIDSDFYLDKAEDGEADRIALDFYNDTYLSDQNACTSPKLIVWMGKNKETAREVFWGKLYELVKKKYEFWDITAVDKFALAQHFAAENEGSRIIAREDNVLVRIEIGKIRRDYVELDIKAGLFLEYCCDDIMDLREICDDSHVQTVGVLGNDSMVEPLLLSGIHGVDRVTDIGKTMDFDLIWDGYDLIRQMSRTIGGRAL